jgi:GT2 family glycosyltransferase
MTTDRAPPRAGSPPAVELSIVIVNWNSKDYVRACLDSIVASRPGMSFEVIVVDSGSFDGCGDMLARHHPRVTFKQCVKNIGFGQASNLGVEMARGSTVLLLNPDTAIVGNGLSVLLAQLKSLPRAGIVGCRLSNADGSLQTSCVQPYPTILNQILDARALHLLFPGSRLCTTAASYEQLQRPSAVEVIVGACMMIRRNVFLQVGGFSADYFMYAEDVDLCHKLCAAGYINYYVPDVSVLHHGGGTTRRAESRFSTVMKRESIARYMSKTSGDLYAAGYRAASGCAAVLRILMLCLFLPAALAKHRVMLWRAALGKWTCVLRWSLGMERWAQNFDGIHRADDVGSGMKARS